MQLNDVTYIGYINYLKYNQLICNYVNYNVGTYYVHFSCVNLLWLIINEIYEQCVTKIEYYN